MERPRKRLENDGPFDDGLHDHSIIIRSQRPTVSSKVGAIKGTSIRFLYVARYFAIALAKCNQFSRERNDPARVVRIRRQVMKVVVALHQ